LKFLEDQFNTRFSSSQRKFIENEVHELTYNEFYFVTVNSTDVCDVGVGGLGIEIERIIKNNKSYIRIHEIIPNGFADINGHLKVGDMILELEIHLAYKNKIVSFIDKKLEVCKKLLRTKKRPIVLSMRKRTENFVDDDQGYDVVVPSGGGQKFKLGMSIFDGDSFEGMEVTAIKPGSFIDEEGTVGLGDYLMGVVGSNGKFKRLSYDEVVHMNLRKRPFVLRFKRTKTPVNDETYMQEDEDEEEEEGEEEINNNNNTSSPSPKRKIQNINDLRLEAFSYLPNKLGMEAICDKLKAKNYVGFEYYHYGVFSRQPGIYGKILPDGMIENKNGSPLAVATWIKENYPEGGHTMKKFDYKKCFIVDVDGKKLANKLDLFAFRKGVDVTFNKNVEEVEEGEKEQEQEKEVEEGEKEQEG